MLTYFLSTVNYFISSTPDHDVYNSIVAMLSSKDLNRVRQTGYLWDHSWRFISMLAGEPFLEADCLYYYDGRCLFFYGFPLLHSPSLDPASTFASVVARLKPEAVFYSGMTPIREHDIEADYVPIYDNIPDSSNVCMNIALDCYQMSESYQRRKWIKYGHEKGWRIIKAKGGVFGKDHIEIIREFLDRVSPSYFPRACISRLGDFSRISNTTLLEVRSSDRLISFCVIENWFKECDIFIYGFSKNNEDGAADFMHYGMIEETLKRRKKSLSLGYSINQGLFRFKKKWGAVPSNDGYYDQAWKKPAINISFPHWPNRILTDSMMVCP